MNFYLDFEATQFSQKVISIGCITENQKQFYTLVKPKNHKLTKFITSLTGITNEMLEDAPSTEEAFRQLKNFVNSFDKPHRFFAYGTEDVIFIGRSMYEVQDMDVLNFMGKLKREIVDYSAVIQNRMNTMGSLKHMFKSIYDTDIDQQHNALEDAMMLRAVAQGFSILTDGEVTQVKKRLKIEQSKPKVVCRAEEEFLRERAAMRESPMIRLFNSWDGYKAFAADTMADRRVYTVKYITTNHKKYFDSYETAALWLIKYKLNGKSPYNKYHVDEVIKAIKHAVRTQSSFVDGRWYK